MNIFKNNLLELNDNAQMIFITSSSAALEILFDGCDTVEQINRKADELIDLIF
ncbi:MAG: hypothetical protein IKG39_07380 [Lachnospiraceae bacterium]|nr:hypothetical protein [Lachnospiraceae bacterium]